MAMQQLNGCVMQARKALGLCPELLTVEGPVQRPALTLAEVQDAARRFEGPAAFDSRALLLDVPLIIDYGVQVASRLYLQIVARSKAMPSGFRLTRTRYIESLPPPRS